MTSANVQIELKKGDKYSINNFVGEFKGEGIPNELVYAKNGTIRLNGVKVQGDCIRVSGNVVTVGFVDIRDCYKVDRNEDGDEVKEYIGKSYSLLESTAELWDTVSNPNALDTLSFESEKGIYYSFTMKDYL